MPAAANPDSRYNPPGTPDYSTEGPAPYSYSPPPAPSSPQTYYPTGPRTTRSPWYYRPKARGAGTPKKRDIFAGIPGPEVDAATQLITTFASLIGYPVGVDWSQAAADLIHSGVNPASHQDVYTWLWSSKYLSDAQRKANPWAEFGLDIDTYRSVINKLHNTYFDIVGDQMSDAVTKRAIRENWSPTEIQNYLQFGDPRGRMEGMTPPSMVDAPWVEEGGTYKQSLEQYNATVGRPPTDKYTLAAWYRFGSASRKITPSAQPTQLVRRQRPQPEPTDVEVR